jgi:archaellum component FlaC
MESPEPTREQLIETVKELREEVARLKEELRRTRRDTHEVPPHYL